MQSNQSDCNDLLGEVGFSPSDLAESPTNTRCGLPEVISSQTVLYAVQVLTCLYNGDSEHRFLASCAFQLHAKFRLHGARVFLHTFVAKPPHLCLLAFGIILFQNHLEIRDESS